VIPSTSYQSWQALHYFTNFELQQRNIAHWHALALIGDGDASDGEDREASQTMITCMKISTGQLLKMITWLQLHTTWTH